MAHNLRNPNDKKYFGHTTSKPQKWVTTTVRRSKKSPLKKAAGPVKLNPAYVEWKEKQEEKISKIKFKKHLKKKQVINN